MLVCVCVCVCVCMCVFVCLCVTPLCWKGMVCWYFIVYSMEGLMWYRFSSSRLQPSYFRHQGRLRYLDFFLSCMTLIHLFYLFFITRCFFSSLTPHVRAPTMLFSTKSFHPKPLLSHVDVLLQSLKNKLLYLLSQVTACIFFVVLFVQHS